MYLLHSSAYSLILSCNLDPGRGKVVAPIVRFKNAKELIGSAAVLVSVDEFESLLLRHVIISLCLP